MAARALNHVAVAMSTLAALQTRTRAVRRSLDAEQGEAQSLARRGQAVQAEIAELTADAVLYEKVNAVLNSIAETRQQEAQLKIEGLVTQGLQTIFGPELSFHVVQTTKAKASHVDFLVRTTLPGGAQIDTPIMEARGGGLAAVIGFLLRVVVMLLDKTDASQILVLDETFAMVSAEYLEPLGEFLRELVTKTGIQIVMVTHQPVLAEYADRAYRFTLDAQGQTQTKELT